jgi:hypothetical protein
MYVCVCTDCVEYFFFQYAWECNNFYDLAPYKYFNYLGVSLEQCRSGCFGCFLMSACAKKLIALEQISLLSWNFPVVPKCLHLAQCFEGLTQIISKNHLDNFRRLPCGVVLVHLKNFLNANIACSQYDIVTTVGLLSWGHVKIHVILDARKNCSTEQTPKVILMILGSSLWVPLPVGPIPARSYFL